MQWHFGEAHGRCRCLMLFGQLGYRRKWPCFSICSTCPCRLKRNLLVMTDLNFFWDGFLVKDLLASIGRIHADVICVSSFDGRGGSS
jgi:hypothetical protein